MYAYIFKFIHIEYDLLLYVTTYVRSYITCDYPHTEYILNMIYLCVYLHNLLVVELHFRLPICTQCIHIAYHYFLSVFT